LQYGLKAQAANFYREDSVTGWRLDFRPYVEKRWQKAWGWLAPRLDYRLTEYDLKDSNGNDRPDRSLPIFSLDSGLRLEKNFPDGSFKTLEPRLFYVFAPYRDQEDIPLFDTHGLTFGSALLFQTNRFSGADRQMDANIEWRAPEPLCVAIDCRVQLPARRPLEWDLESALGPGNQRNLDANTTIEALAGIEHRSCCWAFRLVARRFIYNEAGDAKNGVYAEIQFNGLGSLGRNPRRLLKQSIPGYSEEY